MNDKYLESKLLSFKKLSQYLTEIKNFSLKVWEKPHLQWFTNHDVEHSEEIIYLIGQIVKSIENDTEIFFNEDELFILLASAYLHDIGMQLSKIETYSIDGLSSEQYDLIRKRHAEESYHIILKRLLPSVNRDDFHFPSIDEEYLPAIARVSKGHSTEYFQEIIELFNTDPLKPKGRKVRGEFLTALLMIADELDLQCKRVNFYDTAKFSLSDVSLLHWYKHHYVECVEIKDGRINVTLRFPSDSDNYCNLIKELIENKLVEQVKKVNPILLKSTKRKLSFEETINIEIRRDIEGVKRRLPEGALKELEKEIKKKDKVVPSDVNDVPRGYVYIKAGQHLGVHILSRQKDNQSVLYLPVGGGSSSHFLIDKYLVTNVQYAMFLNSDENRKKTSIKLLHDGSRVVVTSEDQLLAGELLTYWERKRPKPNFVWGLQYGPQGWQPISGSENLPMTYVTALGASWYATWANQFPGTEFESISSGLLGLPTQVEWTTAALFDYKTGRELKFPWGDRWNNSCLNSKSYWMKEEPHPTRVDAFPDGASPNGMLDAFGNVWEWLADSTSDRKQVICGGGCTTSDNQFPAIDSRQADTGSPYIGFRCCRSLK